MKKTIIFKAITILCLISFSTQGFSYHPPEKLLFKTKFLSIQSKLKQYTIFFSISQILEEILESEEDKGRVEFFWIEYENGDDLISFHLKFEGDLITIEISDAYLKENKKAKKINLLDLAKKTHPEGDYSYLEFKKVLFKICENPHLEFKLKKLKKEKKIKASKINFPFARNHLNKNNLRLFLTPLQLAAGTIGVTIFASVIGGIIFYDNNITKLLPKKNKKTGNKLLSYLKPIQTNRVKSHVKLILKLFEGINNHTFNAKPQKR